MRSKRNFCIDIILVCVVLGIVAYIVSLVQVRPAGAVGTPCGKHLSTSCRNRSGGARNRSN